MKCCLTLPNSGDKLFLQKVFKGIWLDMAWHLGAAVVEMSGYHKYDEMKRILVKKHNFSFGACTVEWHCHAPPIRPILTFQSQKFAASKLRSLRWWQLRSCQKVGVKTPLKWFHLLGISPLLNQTMESIKSTFPENSQFASENGRLEDEISFWEDLFSGALFSFREGIYIYMSYTCSYNRLNSCNIIGINPLAGRM